MLVERSYHDRQLGTLLGDLPRRYKNRYTEAASNELVENLFTSLAGNQTDHLQLLFPSGPPQGNKRWSLREAQGAVLGAEYSEAARGHPCGHIFKNGEATYRCSTCSSDDTCVLCTRCFDASDHEGHNVFVNLSPGNSGCCDCGDPEAWIRDVPCTIHTASSSASKSAGKAKEGSSVPPELVNTIQKTISRTLDYLCDVFSCSPEQLRLPKTEESVLDDEKHSRLPSNIYMMNEDDDADSEFCLILWNDEKHTVNDVRDQVARACRMTEDEALNKAHEVDDVGRSIVMFSDDLGNLLNAAKIIEQPKLTVTVRSARDTFREQMCATIVEWISDIAGCQVGDDPNLLRSTICKELLKTWRMGSHAHHKEVGSEGLDDHAVEEVEDDYLRYYGRYPANPATAARIRRAWGASDDNEDSSDSDSDDDENAGPEEDEMDIDEDSADQEFGDMEVDDFDDALETSEATLAGYPPPPPPPPQPRRRHQGTASADSDDGEPTPTNGPLMAVPKTPMKPSRSIRPPKTPRYWLEKPDRYRKQKDVPLAEDLWNRVRLDYFILYDLRMWKQLRTDLRDVFISTVVTLPFFKRLLGLRFAGVYTVLAELYLIADREPDHSIINLSLQMLTTPTITLEIVERGNFLTNLIAILYTFLTTRQVGYPSDVNVASTLAIEQGAVTNRRTFHFFLDMRYLLSSDLVQEKIRSEDRYLMQFLDLAKLHQGICPNVRAIGEHVEFETDAWLNATTIVQETIKLCKFLGECFSLRSENDVADLCRAIRNTARVTIINCLGSERRRFDQSEIKTDIRFKHLPAFEFDIDIGLGPEGYRVVDYIVEEQHMSFHHALHYTLSWLIDKGKAMSRDQILGLMLFSTQELRQPPVPPWSHIPEFQPEDHLLALFDFPLRVLAWLAQMRAGMWVRNGITLRHQMGQYRAFPRREWSYQRDIFMVQTAFCILPPGTVLASAVDRFDITELVRGHYNLKAGKEEQQQIEVAEDFVHLLIILLTDRIHLRPLESDPDPQLTTARRSVIHSLCFKPLSYSSLTGQIADKFSDTEAFDELIQELTVYKPPEGTSDTGTFLLKEKLYEEIDPYLSYFSRNQREEAENIYRKHMAASLGKDPADVVYEPKLRPIQSGVFKDIANFTRTPLFAQIIFYLLQYTMVADRYAPSVPSTKVEQFLQFTLHLILIAVQEDRIEDESMSGDDGLRSFCTMALTKRARLPLANCDTIALLLRRISEMETFQSCEPKVQTILQHLRHKRPNEYMEWARKMDVPVERSATASPMPTEDMESKKKQSLDRQARVMAQFRQQQNSFLANQATIDWGEEDFSDLDDEFQTPTEEEEKVWKFPSGTCILCQEETNEDKLYGTFALVNESRILRQTNMATEWVAEAAETPTSLDRSAEAKRPFGVAGQNHRKIHKITAEGKVLEVERQELAKGFPYNNQKTGPVATGCGHIMHFTCFEVYLQATYRRHTTQIARNHPERLTKKEFLCPLCKALGNAFLPVIWKGKNIRYPGELEPEVPFEQFLENQISVQMSKFEKAPEGSENPTMIHRSEKLFLDYGTHEMVTPIASRLQDLTKTKTAFHAVPQLSERQILLGQTRVVMTMSADDAIISSIDLLGMPGATSTTAIPPQLMELIKVYQRLRDTMKINSLNSQFGYPTEQEDLDCTDTLARSLGFSISAAEIAQRGIESDPGATLLDKISSQTITHLRVLSETISSYTAIGGLKNGGKNKTNEEFFFSQVYQLHQLFVGHPAVCSLEELAGDYPDKRANLKNRSPLLTMDPFVFLTECAAALVPSLHLDIHHIMRLCYVAEIIRVVAVYLLRDELTDLNIVPDAGPEELTGFSILVDHVKKEIHPHSSKKSTTFLERAHRLTASYALPFLRKCTILLHVRYGIEFPPTNGTHDEAELARLSRTLHLPGLDELVLEVVQSSATLDMITGWLQHWALYREGSRATKSQITLSHPAIFELVGLPRNFDSLQDEAMRKRCPTTGKDLTDPVVCLFCGEIFCSQAVCCKKETDKGSVGGCFQHRKKCGGTIGLFINIRKCMVLFLNGENGSWSYAPYLDKHGETDATLRRSHQLFLNQKRYDKLYREVWLLHLVPSTIARRLEADNNNGGWETL